MKELIVSFVSMWIGVGIGCWVNRFALKELRSAMKNKVNVAYDKGYAKGMMDEFVHQEEVNKENKLME